MLQGHCYSRSERMGTVLGKIGNKPLPFTITEAQVKTGASVTGPLLVILLWVHTYIGWFLSGLALVGIPIATMYLVRYFRIDGMGPGAFLGGIARVVVEPRHGKIRGRAYRPGESPRRRTHRLWIGHPHLRRQP